MIRFYMLLITLAIIILLAAEIIIQCSIERQIDDVREHYISRLGDHGFCRA